MALADYLKWATELIDYTLILGECPEIGPRGYSCVIAGGVGAQFCLRLPAKRFLPDDEAILAARHVLDGLPASAVRLLPCQLQRVKSGGWRVQACIKRKSLLFDRVIQVFGGTRVKYYIPALRGHNARNEDHRMCP